MFGIPAHFLLVHFPIALIVAALVCDLRHAADAGYRLTLGAAAGAALAILSGLLLTSGRVAAVATHAGAGITGGLVTVTLAMLRYSQRARGEEGRGWLALELLAVLGIVVAAITGHQAALAGF